MKLSRRHLLGSVALFGTAIPFQLAAQPSSSVEKDIISNNSGALHVLEGRERLSLDGAWHYILDPFDVAGRKPKARRNFWENTIETPATGLIEYEWNSSPRMMLPAAWNDAEERLDYYEGPVYFRRLFTAPIEAEKRHFLHFEAVNYAATVWLDGNLVGRHEGGFTPFSIEVTDCIRSGTAHSLVVRADSRHGPKTLPGLDFDWKNCGGITRSVSLLSVPRNFIRSSFISLRNSQIEAAIEVDGDAGTSVKLNCPALGLTLSGSAGEDGKITLSAPAPDNLKLWSPDDPHLYNFTITCGNETAIEQIGFRVVEVRGREVLLNGKSIFLRGIAMHEEAFGAKGERAVSEAEARALLAEAKALGCNFVRLAHYPHAAHTARLADEMGLMLWAEIPVYWEEIDYSDKGTLALARGMMAELVRRDSNRASVVMWSVANETPQTPVRTRFLRTVIADVRRFDPTRLVTAALNKNVDVGGVRDGESIITVQDELAADLDVVAINQYEGWYGKRDPREIKQVSFRNGYDKPLMFSEFGAGAPYGNHGPREERWTEEYQAWLYEETLKIIAETPDCVGLSPWLLKDFRSPRRWHGRFQELWNRKGLTSPEGRRKKAWFVLRDYYRNIAVPKG
ncbi:beta-glucuronidase [Parasphingorhabdus litoris]|uniref:Beta-glucuronidase n=1 Tax=Parasphingorhabdus litoris TaxID=394733 RepID=A0ABN1ATV4_9SPHN|nr:glycoside hydrolase family 2 TIM barrel-domain containing protein [Parasphingorhabdus litoris]